jgi:hypothetical protein
MIKLWTFGDSFVAGSQRAHRNEFTRKPELFDNSVANAHCIGESESKQWSFTPHLAKYLNVEGINLSKGGFDNSSIINAVRLAYGNIKDDDFVLISFSTPFRGFKEVPADDEDFYPQAFLRFQSQIKEISSLLKGKKFLFTHGFFPIWNFDTSMLDKENGNFIEWGKKNNTLIDICQGSWLDNKQENFIASQKQHLNMFQWTLDGIPRKRKKYISDCKHPSQLGHELIAKTLLPYVEERLSFKND